MHKWKSLYLSTALFSSLFLASCTAEGESYRSSSDEHSDESAKESMNVTDRIVESVISIAVDEIINKHFPEADLDKTENAKKVASELLNHSPNMKGFIEPFLASVQPLVAEAETEYYNVSFSYLSDGDTYTTSVLNSGYTIKQTNEDEEDNKFQIAELSNGESEFSEGEKITIRALLIDTPEVAKKGRKAEAYADEAKEFAEAELKKATSIVVAFDKGQRKDLYSRNLMYVWCDGELLQKKLLEKGLAKIAYITKPNTTYLSELQAAENRAINNKVGIWSSN